MPLTQELRRMGIPVTPFTPSRGADKFTRMHSCAPVFERAALFGVLRLILLMKLWKNALHFPMVNMMTWRIR